MMKPPGEPEGTPRKDVIFRQLVWTWCQTLSGIALMGALLLSAFYFLGLHWSLAAMFLTIWTAIPVVGWYFSQQIVKALTGCKPANPRNPNHQRIIKIVHELYPKTGLPVEPPVFVSPLPIANAFATGRNASNAFIAVTEGLFSVGLTDGELRGVLAHELAHVKGHDVAINSLLAVMGSLFGILLAGGLPNLFSPLVISSGQPLIDKLSDKVRKQKKRFYLPVGGFFGFLLMLTLFYCISFFTKFISLFVSRARESAADVQAIAWTKEPCELHSALQKIYRHILSHPSDLRSGILTSGLLGVLIVSPFEDPELDGATGGGLLARLRKQWRHLGENHPPVPDRLDMLDKIRGKACPRFI
jgi:Zn-dependent protease with chaperone function